MEQNELEDWNNVVYEVPFSEVSIKSTLHLIFYNFPDGFKELEKRQGICKYVLFRVKTVGDKNKIGGEKLDEGYTFYLSMPIESFKAAWKKSGTKIRFGISGVNVKMKIKRITQKTMLISNTEGVFE